MTSDGVPLEVLESLLDLAFTIPASLSSLLSITNDYKLICNVFVERRSEFLKYQVYFYMQDVCRIPNPKVFM